MSLEALNRKVCVLNFYFVILVSGVVGSFTGPLPGGYEMCRQMVVEQDISWDEAFTVSELRGVKDSIVSGSPRRRGDYAAVCFEGGEPPKLDVILTSGIR